LSPCSKKNSSGKTKRKGKNIEIGGNTKAKWVYRVFFLAFALSVFFSFISETILNKANTIFSVFLLLLIIIIGILFDIIGISVTSASETPFHAMAADKVPGGKEAVKLIRNADIVSNFCNDVVGDICGIISGTAGAAIVIKTLVAAKSINETVVSILVAAAISTLTIGGKAIGKGIALKNSKRIVYNVAFFLYILKKELGIDFFSGNYSSK
jgi:hypothetical protein